MHPLFFNDDFQFFWNEISNSEATWKIDVMISINMGDLT
jgi:hypothetical protein